MKTTAPTPRVDKRGLPSPLKAKCFHCQQNFLVKYNPTKGMYSQKNYWGYWTDESWNYQTMRRKKEAERGQKICDRCLRENYLKKKWEFLDQVKSKGKRQTLRSYIYHNII